jgi:tRNA A37 methylthiotransferase MiaB
MKIMLIYGKPDVVKKPRFGFSYEMLIISTILKKDFDVYIKDYSCEKFDENELSWELKEKMIDIVLIECDSFALKRSENINNVLRTISIIKRINKEIKVISYGNQCYISKQDILGADCTIKNNDINKIILAINKYASCSVPLKYESYDSLPIVDRKMLQCIDYYKNNKNSTLIQTSKGCENTCIFCQRKGWQKKYEVHSDEYVIEEFVQLKNEGYRNVWIIDENFTFNLSRAKRILQKLIITGATKNMKIFISSWANIDYEFLDLAVTCNIKIISFGIETANENILKFYRKNINLEKVKKMILYANSIGLFTVGNFILGAPMETEDTINKTFEFIKTCEFDQVNIKTLDYMIGSELYDSMNEELKSNSHVFACLENGLNQFTLQELIERKQNFITYYYSLHRKKINEKIKKYGTPHD